jgi:hypothetical protein
VLKPAADLTEKRGQTRRGIAMATDYKDRLIAEVQERVPEPITHVGLLQPAGSWAASGASMLSGLGGMLARKQANQRANGLTKNVAFGKMKMALVAVTATRVYVFDAKSKGRFWKIGDEVAAWDRTDLTVTTVPGKLSSKVGIDVTSSGDHFELEATRVGTLRFHDDFLAEIAA